jgi:hypothetical protein
MLLVLLWALCAGFVEPLLLVLAKATSALDTWAQ